MADMVVEMDVEKGLALILYFRLQIRAGSGEGLRREYDVAKIYIVLSYVNTN